MVLWDIELPCGRCTAPKRPSEGLFALPTMSLSALPNELLFHILFELTSSHGGENNLTEVAEVRRDLSSCALVSKRWTDAAQPLLFQDAAVALQSEHGASRACALWGLGLLSMTSRRPS